MNTSLIIKRAHISFDDTTYDFLNNLSDYPMIDGYIFSKIFDKKEELCLFFNHLEQSELIEEYDEDYFKDHKLLVMFSDERSGSNKLEINDIEIKDNAISIIIDRERGLTMDMSYLFMFYEIDDKNVNNSKVLIQNKDYNWQ